MKTVTVVTIVTIVLSMNYEIPPLASGLIYKLTTSPSNKALPLNELLNRMR